jgi:hypothetical protein
VVNPSLNNTKSLEFCDDRYITTACQDCLKKYCYNCFDALHSPKKFKNHQSIDPSKIIIPPKCINHPEKLAELYCVPEKCCICYECSFKEFKNQKCIELKEECKRIQNEIESFRLSDELEYLNTSIRSKEKKIENLEESKLKLIQSRDVIEEIISKSFDNWDLLDLINVKEKLNLNVNAQFRKAVNYEMGIGMACDLDRAMELFQWCQKHGEPRASAKLKTISKKQKKERNQTHRKNGRVRNQKKKNFK